jgi:allantoinase
MIIKNGLVALAGKSDFEKVSILVQNGKIVKLGKNIEAANEEEIDAEGLYIMPGAIDAHVHFNTPGFEEREDFYHGSSFSASGGVTTVIDMPCTSLPPVTNLENLQYKLDVVKEQAVVDYAFFGGISGNNLSGLHHKMEELSPHVRGYKCYLISGMESFTSLTYSQLARALSLSREFKKTVLLHAEEKLYISRAEAREKRQGISAENYYRTRPEVVELKAVQRAGEICSETGGDLHIVHISTGKGAEIAAAHGISVETCPHYLAFELKDFVHRGSILKVAPVLKQDERGKLWEHLRDGTINFVTSDHAASRFQDKDTESIWTDYAGIAGSGLLLPYMISEGFFKKRINLKRLLELVCENPAKRYKLNTRKGKIAAGMDADFALIDPKRYYRISGREFLSKGKQTPFEGYEFRGKVVKTILRGKVIYQENRGILSKAGSGEFLGG